MPMLSSKRLIILILISLVYYELIFLTWCEERSQIHALDVDFAEEKIILTLAKENKENFERLLHWGFAIGERDWAQLQMQYAKVGIYSPGAESGGCQ